ncbi:MAG: hypothetical protein A2017_07250 [Lentisphaerae bacterium GWF2_44_16]|nr:MAG: hypothetical protein A2017_07250 [Lentisphaerae bacterium GWF2_44_16]
MIVTTIIYESKVMRKNGKSPAPALENGMQILEEIAGGNGIAFNKIVEKLSLPESSAVRYLKVLIQRDYISKDPKSGLYYSGSGLSKLIKMDSVAGKIREKLDTVLKSLTQNTGNTSIFVYWNGSLWQCLGKELNEDSIAMQNINDVRHDILSYPWSPFIFNGFSETRKKIELSRYPDFKKLAEKLEASYKFFLRNGYVLYESESIRRLSAPVSMKENVFCGAMALGGTCSSMPEKSISRLAKILKEHARLLSIELKDIK